MTTRAAPETLRARAIVRPALIVALIALVIAPAAADAKRVRVFAVGPKIDMAWLQTPAQYRAKLFALMDRRLRGPGTPPVQRGAGDVASRLLGPSDPRRPVATARDLVTFPEDLGLLAAFVGPRGAAARQVPAESGALVSAVASLLGTYGPVMDYYAARYPALTQRALPTRLLALALTDQFVSTAVETYAEIADRYDVYLAGGAIAASDWRIVCEDRSTFRPPPSGERCAVEDPALVARLRDPGQPDRNYAYEATTDKPVNFALLFDPDGRLIAKERKVYLTPLELPAGLDLVPGPVSGLRAIPTPVGRLGFVTSKDSWMPDITAKLDQRNVNVLVQPEFFVDDTVRTTGQWAPDTLLSSGYSNILRHPSMGTLVLPEMTGNLLDFSADAQQHIARKPLGGGRAGGGPGARGVPKGWLVGQPQHPGLGPVERWVVPDPQRPHVPFPTRRHRLGIAGETLAPLGSGPPCPNPLVAGPCKGGQVEGVLAADTTVGAPRRRTAPGPSARTAFSPNRPLASGPGRQRNVHLAARGREVFAVFEEQRGGRDRIVLARSGDAGATWRRVGHPAGERAPRQWWPSVAVGPEGRVWVAWQDDRTGTPRVRVASAHAGRTGRMRFSRPIEVGRAAPPRAAQWRPSVASGRPGEAVVAWVDERRRSPGDDLAQESIFTARVTAAGTIRDEQRLDLETPVTEAQELANAWAPSIAARGRNVLVTWVDFRRYDWDVIARISRDGGASFGAEIQVNDTPDADEALDDTPRAALGPGGRPLVAFTDWRKRASTARRPHQLYDTAIAVPGRRPRRVDHHGDRQVSTFSPAIAPLSGGNALVAWQDAALGVNQIEVTHVAAGSAGGRRSSVSDLRPGAANMWRPALAVAGRRAVVAWEDDREGVGQIYVARASVDRIGRRARQGPALTGRADADAARR